MEITDIDDNVVPKIQVLIEEKNPEKQTYYITFGASGIRDGWVEFTASNERIARYYAKEFYGKCWSGIYTSHNWEPQYFPVGCIGRVPLP